MGLMFKVASYQKCEKMVHAPLDIVKLSETIDAKSHVVCHG